jgi:hypothetical protein
VICREQVRIYELILIWTIWMNSVMVLAAVVVVGWVSADAVGMIVSME